MRFILSIFLTFFAALFASLLLETGAMAQNGMPYSMPSGAATSGGALCLGLALVVAISGGRRLRAANEENMRLLAAAESLRQEMASHVRAEEALTAECSEVEGSAQSLAQMNALLAKASGRFQELFQGLPVACVCYDRDGHIMEWNRAFERLHTLENALGQSVWTTIYARQDSPRIVEAARAVFEGQAQKGIEWTCRREDGSEAQLYSSIFPLRGACGEIEGAISADVDISAQQAAEDALRESEERLHTLYNTTSQQNLTFDEKTDAMLEMGCEQFGLEIGILAQVRDTQYEIIYARSPHNLLPCGTVLPVCDTYCAEALALADALSFEEAGTTERRESAIYQQLGLEAYIGTPVRVNGIIWGMLCFAGKKPSLRLFTSGDRELVRLMAQWLGGEIARRQAEDAVQESEERFRTAIASISEGLIVMGADGVIRLWNDSAERILQKTQSEMRGWHPLNPDFKPVREDGSTFPEGSYPLMISLLRGEPQTNVVMGLPRSGGGLVWVSVNSKPLFPEGGGPPSAVVATFADITERRRHEDLIAAQLLQIQEHTATLEEQKKELETVNSELETLALRDGLTGLSNRRAFGQRLTLEMGRATRYGLPLSLLLLDVDQFKEYNDSFGHVAGDEVLRLLSHMLYVEGRETDFFARYGGEEFVIILPHTDSEGALTVAERLRKAIASSAWPSRPVTASIGAATLLPNMETEDSFVSAADRALYAAKTSGRNRVRHALSIGIDVAEAMSA
jgi:diguanylate cyclase (GGDEF)-like protein/PAS domain S-box-containing protein